MCTCYTEIEDAEHYLKLCPLYVNNRNTIRDTQGWDIFDMECEELLYGSNMLDNEENQSLFEMVPFYIGLTKRFT